MAFASGPASAGGGVAAASGMLASPPLEPTRTAVVVIDMVNHQTTPGQGCLADMQRYGIDTTYYHTRLCQRVIPNIDRLAATVRASGGQVIHLRLAATRADLADTNPHLRPFLRTWGAIDGTPACDIIADLAPRPGDIDLVKTGSSGFTTAALETHLHQAGVEHVCYTGVITNACVLLTLATGFDRGYDGYLVRDATATLSQHTQDSTEELVDGFLAHVCTTDHITAALTGPNPR